MMTKSAILVFPGSNCVDEMERFLLSIFDTPPIKIWHKEEQLPDADFFVLPGGFSYGDYVRSGMLAAMCPLMEDLKVAAEDGKKILGVCNGFQILCELGLLPGTLRMNESGKFICKPVVIQDELSLDEYRIPIAHGEGNYYAKVDYLFELGYSVNVAQTYMDNPNGSMNDIAGVYNKHETVLGMMPHPERAFETYHVSQDGPKSIWKLLI